MLKDWQWYVLLAPAIIYFAIFSYGPMYGVQIAFKDFKASKGILGSNWAGFSHFIRFFNSYYFWDLIRNTVVISVYGLIVGFPLPIILALCINELKEGRFKKTVQTVTYAPHFISTVVFCGMIIAFLSPTTGIINKAIIALGGERMAFLSEPAYFPSIYVWSDVWQNVGWGSIIYLATLSGIDVALYEAATIDGASRFQKMRYINIPLLIPIIVTLLILNSGRVLSVGYEKTLLLQNSLNLKTSEVISTFVYKSGLLQAQYSFSAAVGLFNSIINLIILFTVNKVSQKISENSLW
jgi:putative aldouronate transport system permease protein